jgi:hypothetical protein
MDKCHYCYISTLHAFLLVATTFDIYMLDLIV